MDLDDFDLDELKEDLINYFGTASRYFQVAMMNVIDIEKCSGEELISLAINNGFDLSNYTKKRLK